MAPNAAVTSLAITVVGHDRPGIIAEVAEALADWGMNLEDSSMTLLRGHFAMTLICAGDAAAATWRRRSPRSADGCWRDRPRRCRPRRMPRRRASRYLVTRARRRPAGHRRRGRPGVVAAAGGNITDLTTRLSGALYVLLAEVDLPAGPTSTALRARLAEAAAELGRRGDPAPRRVATIL